MKFIVPLILILLFSQVISLKIDFEEENLAPKIKTRIQDLLSKIPQEGSEQILISVGDTNLSKQFISKEELKKQGSEGYIVKVKKNLQRNNILYKLVFISNGNELKDHYPNHPNSKNAIGTTFGVFHILELIGFGFLHPFSPLIPDLREVELLLNNFYEKNEIEFFEKPSFEARGTHLHTQHPIELTEYLNGFGKNLSQQHSHWEVMKPKYELFLEWMVANKQNRLEWYLLWAESWKEYGDSTLRQERLKIMVNLGHEFGLAVGIVAPFVFMQQHSWMLIRKSGTIEFEIDQIKTHIDWLMKTDIDFITAEMGQSEFVPSDSKRMIRWFDESLKYLHDKYERKGFYTKIHISSDQYAQEFNDPWTGKPPINFNFIPYYADKRLGVMPHTVQVYALDDPAPTYGNKNFTHMLNYMFLEADRRETLFYPETAYWVFYDINVPLFLPLYAERRLHDLRLIRNLERRLNKKVKGQINFSSGWEFTYWLNDVITARSAWNPLENVSDEIALKSMIHLITKHFGQHQIEIQNILHDLMKDQKLYLIDGMVNGQKPNEISKRSGIAYLQGWDTWCDLPKLLEGSTDFEFNPQPDKITLEEVKEGKDINPNYKRDIQPLLLEMFNKFRTYSSKINSFKNSIPQHSKHLFEDISNSLELFVLRINLVLSLYDYQHGVFTNQPNSYLNEKQRIAFNSLKRAEELIEDQKKIFKLPTEFISSYHKNPTVYSYNYLFTATTLHYWKRDFMKVITRPHSGPCLMNIQNPVDIALGEGVLQDSAQKLRNFFENTPMNYITECVAAPKHNDE